MAHPGSHDPVAGPRRPFRPHAAVPWALLAAWTALLATGVVRPRSLLGETGLTSLSSSGRLLALALKGLGWGTAEALCFAPLGFLAVLGLPDRERPWTRARLVALPAFGIGLALAALVVWLGAPPGPRPLLLALALVLPAAGIALGVSAGLAWRRGPRARLLFLPKLMALGAGVLLAAGAFAWLATEGAALVPEPTPISSADKRRLYASFTGQSPGEVRTIRLTGPDIERLLAWARSVQGRGRAAVSLEGNGVAAATASVRVPHLRGRWLNVAASVRLAVDGGRLDLALLSLRIGRLEVPGLLRDALAFLATGVLSASAGSHGALGAVHSLRLDREALTVTFRRIDGPRGLLARLVWGEEAAGAVRAGVGAYLSQLLGALPHTAKGDERFAAALAAAFRLARERSRGGSALEENRQALIALGIVLGHERIAAAIGEPIDEDRAESIRRVRDGTTVRGRADWVRHFTVSGALTVLGSVAPSDAAGLFKEEKDADGGSGFSFGDLLADRAGTTFADVATRGEAGAAAMQERLAPGIRIEDLFPPAADFPEGIQDADLQKRYGGVGGPLFRVQAEEIERRIAALPLYRR